MKKIICVLTAVVAVLLLAGSCSGENGAKSGTETEGESQEEAVSAEKDGFRPTETAVRGPLKKYFEVVDRAYKLPNESFGEVYIDIKRLSGELPLREGESFIESDTKKSGGLYIRLLIEYLDENGDVIDTSKQNDFDDLVSLAQADEGDLGTISFYLPMSSKVKPAKFRIKSFMEQVANTEGKKDDFDEALEGLKGAAEAVGAIGEAANAAARAAEAASRR